MVGHEIRTTPIPPPTATVTTIHQPAALVPARLQAHAHPLPATAAGATPLHLATVSREMGTRPHRPHDQLSARHDHQQHIGDLNIMTDPNAANPDAAAISERLDNLFENIARNPAETGLDELFEALADVALMGQHLALQLATVRAENARLRAELAERNHAS